MSAGTQSEKAQVLHAIADCLDVGMDGIDMIEAVAREFVGNSDEPSCVTVETKSGDTYEITVTKRTW